MKLKSSSSDAPSGEDSTSEKTLVKEEKKVPDEKTDLSKLHFMRSSSSEIGYAPEEEPKETLSVKKRI